jgi:hypothetical protein
MSARGKSKAECEQLVQELKKYKAGEEPYNNPFDSSKGSTLKTWWQAVDGVCNAILVELAVLLADLCPHSADPERIFSIMGWIHNKLRNCLDASMVGMLAFIKKFHQATNPRPQSAASRCESRGRRGHVAT